MRRTAGTILRRLSRLGVPRGGSPIVLMYHRVAEPHVDPWGICVSPDRFAEQVAMLAAEFAPMTMDDLVAALADGSTPRRAIALTFDDGYADNVLVARPILHRYGVPATLFLATERIGDGARYWWDELADMVLLRREAASFVLDVAGVRLAGDWGEQPALPPALAAWRVGEGREAGRAAAYLTLWSALQELPPTKREEAMAALRTALPVAPAGECGDLPMNADLARVASGGVTRLGGHGRSHTPLPRLSFDEQAAEIAGGRADVAALAGGEAPTGFAYPHGEWDADTKRIVREAGYSWAVGSRNDAIDPRRYDLFDLPRVGVGDWSADRLRRRLRAIGG